MNFTAFLVGGVEKLYASDPGWSRGVSAAQVPPFPDIGWIMPVLFLVLEHYFNFLVVPVQPLMRER
jgi:hypothetical protein